MDSGFASRIRANCRDAHRINRLKLPAPEREWAPRGLRAQGTGAVGCRGGLFAAASAGTAGRGGGGGTAAAGAGRGAGPGSGVMMLTGGVEAAEGKSALVGLPVGI